MNIPSTEELLKQIMGTVEVAWRNRLAQPIIDKWLSNFTGEALGDVEYEKNLAIWLLYNFTYINEEETKYLCRLLLRKYLHKYLQGNVVNDSDINELLRNTRFFPLGRASESGAFILYLFRQENELPIFFFDNGSSDLEGKKIACIDDMTLSGSQASRYIARIKYGNYLIDEFEGKGISHIFEEKNKGDIQRKLLNHIESTRVDKSNESKIKNVINNRLIKNTELISNVLTQGDISKLSGNGQNLLELYFSQKEKMSEYAIYKLNRLLLEFAFPSCIAPSREILENENIVLLTFIASEEAIEKLRENGIEVISCITLDKMSKAFEMESMAFSGFPQARTDCKKMCEHYGAKIKPKEPLGYNDCQYLIGLYYTIPNNTLPIFWGSEGWNPIFIRHEKQYKKEAEISGKFI